MTDCVFCGIVAGHEPAVTVRVWSDAVAFVPLNPVVSGHVLVIPRLHVIGAVENPAVTAMTMARAAELASEYTASNIMTSAGAAAGQSVFHLHVHVVPRVVGDQLLVPWGTTGDPHAPHRCGGMNQLAAELAAAKAKVSTTVAAGIRVHHGPDPTGVVRYVGVPYEAWLREGPIR